MTTCLVHKAAKRGAQSSSTHVARVLGPVDVLGSSPEQWGAVWLVQAHVNALPAIFGAFLHEGILAHEVRHMICVLIIRAWDTADGGALLDGRPACACALHRESQQSLHANGRQSFACHARSLTHRTPGAQAGRPSSNWPLSGAAWGIARRPTTQLQNQTHTTGVSQFERLLVCAFPSARNV